MYWTFLPRTSPLDPKPYFTNKHSDNALEKLKNNLDVQKMLWASKTVFWTAKKIFVERPKNIFGRPILFWTSKKCFGHSFPGHLHCIQSLSSPTNTLIMLLKNS